jgi:hypothetical protein
MDKTTREHLDNLHSKDGELRYRALMYVLNPTERKVDWAYEVWDGLVADLRHEDNHVRAIAAQVLSNLAGSDPDGRMQKDFGAVLAVTRDERFVTARHTLQSIWKVGRAGKKQRKLVVDGLAARFHECAAEKNRTLIRFDIVVGLRKLYDEVHDEKLREKAQDLISTEEDPKYRKKYESIWRNA